ncbi:MAG: 4-hydroxy-tetrahydrodipicolinate reductase [Clostridia bacterium]|nr:4-hydroxy-tetrahydrodipicolinate reductase [Clostridia bacterium]
MTNVLLNGYLGRMGRVILELSKEREDIEVTAGVDYKAPETEVFSFSTYTDYENITAKPDVIIDFSNPAALDSILTYALNNEVPVVICTTGFNEEQLAAIDEASKTIPVFFSANMSIGVNLISELAKQAAEVLYPGFNIEIIEAHHNQKLDAPSGTALMIADEISSVLEDKVDYEFDRASKREKRPVNEIGIHAVRAGTIVGEHEVLFGGPDEVISIKHHAASRKIFANGALNAAAFLKGKPSGKYSMKDLIG